MKRHTRGDRARGPARGWHLALVAVLATSPVQAQGPRIAPPPPCRLPAGFADPLTDLRLGTSGVPMLVVAPFAQGSAERRVARMPRIVAGRVRGRLRATPGLWVATDGVSERVAFENAGRSGGIRTALATAWILDGLVEAVGQDTRVQATLRAPGDSVAVWSGNFLLSRYSLAEVEQQIAEAVRQALKVKAAVPQPRKAPGRDLELLIAEAEQMLEEHTAASADSARLMLERAFRADTSTAVSLALALATVQTLERTGTPGSPESAASLRRIDALLGYALARDKASAPLWTVWARAARYRDPERMAGADSAHRRAIRLDPRSAEAEHEYAVTLMHQGAWADAGAHFRRALSLDPGRPESLTALAELEQRNGNAPLACALTNAAIAADPFDPRAYITRAQARVMLAQSREAYSDAETALKLEDSPLTHAARLRVEAAAGNTDYARQLAREYAERYLSRAGPMRVDEALAMARAWTVLDFRRQAIGALSRARPLGWALATGLSDRTFDSLRSDAAFAAVVKSARRRSGR